MEKIKLNNKLHKEVLIQHAYKLYVKAVKSDLGYTHGNLYRLDKEKALELIKLGIVTIA